jgi:hypothetical protein
VMARKASKGFGSTAETTNDEKTDTARLSDHRLLKDSGKKAFEVREFPSEYDLCDTMGFPSRSV